MHIASIIEKVNGKYIARVIGEPTLRAEGDTRECAVKALKDTLFMKHFRKEIAMIDVELRGPLKTVSDFNNGTHDPAVMREEIEEIYRERDRQKALEFPE